MKRIGRFFRALFRPVPALLCDAAALGGAGLITYSAWLVYVPSGYFIGGVFLLAAAYLGQRRLV